jgi:hypothetical protein
MKTLSPSPSPLPRRGEEIWLPCNELQGINRFEFPDFFNIDEYRDIPAAPGVAMCFKMVYPERYVDRPMSL